MASQEKIARFKQRQEQWLEMVEAGTLDPDRVVSAVDAVIASPPFLDPPQREDWSLVG